jgi:hypothetical protein
LDPPRAGMIVTTDKSFIESLRAPPLLRWPG